MISHYVSNTPWCSFRIWTFSYKRKDLWKSIHCILSIFSKKLRDSLPKSSSGHLLVSTSKYTVGNTTNCARAVFWNVNLESSRLRWFTICSIHIKEMNWPYFTVVHISIRIKSIPQCMHMKYSLYFKDKYVLWEFDANINARIIIIARKLRSKNKKNKTNLFRV